MDSSEPDVFVDHKETVISAPRPRQMSASKMEIAPPQETEDALNTKAETRVLTQEASGLSSSTVQESATTVEESSSVTGESSSKTSTTVTKHVTTIYTQRISGRSSRSSDSGSDISSPTPGEGGDSANAPVFGSRDSGDAHSPTEVCSVQFSVAAGVTSNTTTAFSRLFTKTVDTTTEVETKERHLSECSISVGGDSTMPHDQETNTEQVCEESSIAAGDGDNQKSVASEAANDDHVFAETLTTVKAEEEKEVSEYCPGLAIRTLTLEDLQEKKLSPERELSPSNNHTGQATEGVISSNANQSNINPSLPADVNQTGLLSSESSVSQMVASESSTSMRSSTFSNSLTSGGQLLMQCTEESAATFRKPIFNPIEVERKFTVTENTEERLRSLGARLHKEKIFTDVYYDNEDYSLILSDCWLRRRNDSWEAKIPLKSQDNSALFAPASQYREISNEKEISAWLVDRLGLDSWMRGDPIDLLVQATGLTEFARFTTTRRSYTLPSCTVDLDLTDHGFRVGEIEVMAASPEEVPQALQTISSMAQQLSVDECDKPLGKMNFYLLNFNPQLYHRLVISFCGVT